MTFENQLTRETAAALVDLIRAVRPAWDARATFDALGEVRGRGDVAYIAYRTLKCALTPEAATPRALTFDATWDEPDQCHRPTLAPPRHRRGEFVPENPAPPEKAAEHIARLRRIVSTNPPPPPSEKP